MTGEAHGTAWGEQPFGIEGCPGARPGHRIVRLSGALGFETVPKFLKLMRAETAPVVIVDLSGVSFMDSAGISSLIQTYTALKKSQRRLALVGPNERVLAVLELTRLRNIFQIFGTLAQAEAKLG